MHPEWEWRAVNFLYIQADINFWKHIFIGREVTTRWPVIAFVRTLCIKFNHSVNKVGGSSRKGMACSKLLVYPGGYKVFGNIYSLGGK